MGDWQCVEDSSTAVEHLRRCVADLRAEIDRLQAEREALRAEREALQAEREANRAEQLLRDACRQERARTFERGLQEQAELLREVFQRREQAPVSVFTTTPLVPGEFGSRFPLISERLRNLNWRLPATLDRVAI